MQLAWPLQPLAAIPRRQAATIPAARHWEQDSRMGTVASVSPESFKTRIIKAARSVRKSNQFGLHDDEVEMAIPTEQQLPVITGNATWGSEPVRLAWHAHQACCIYHETA